MAVIFISESGDEIIGGIGGLVYPDVNTGEKSLLESFWFVDSEWRGQGLRLLASLEKWAKENSVIKMSVCHFVRLNAEQLNRLYLRKGFEPVEVMYSKRVKCQT